VGIYVHDIIYFSSSDAVEHKLEESLSNIGQVDFMGQFFHFLGIEFTWNITTDGHVSVGLTQQTFAENLIDSVGYTSLSISSYTSPYHSGLPIDSIPPSNLNMSEQDLWWLK
jgi:hypothetical protein